MSTGLIIAIVVIALILSAVFAFIMPRARHRAEVRARERELEQRRERVAAVDALVGQALGVGGMGEDGVGKVGAADRLAGRAAGGERGVVELEAELAQAVGHLADPPRAVAAEVLEQGP